MTDEQKRKLDIAKAKRLKPDVKLSVLGNEEVEEIHTKLNDLYKFMGDVVDKLDIKEQTEETGKLLTGLNNNLVKFISSFEQGITVDNLDDIKFDSLKTSTEELIAKFDTLREVKVSNPTKFPEGLAKDQTIKDLSKDLAALTQTFADATPQKPGQNPSDFIPFRRVRMQGNKLVFDDKSWAGASGSGGGATTGNSYNQNTATPYRNINLGATGQSVKASNGWMTGYYVVNRHATLERFIKIYNTAGAPNVGTDVPVITIPLQPQVAANVSLSDHIPFSLGIGIAATTGIADNDTGAPGSNDVVVNIYYI